MNITEYNLILLAYFVFVFAHLRLVLSRVSELFSFRFVAILEVLGIDFHFWNWPQVRPAIA